MRSSLMLPISDDEMLALYRTEREAILALIAHTKDGEKKKQLEEQQSKLHSCIDEYTQKQRVLQEQIEDQVVNPVVRSGWTAALTTTLIGKTLIDILSAAGKSLKPGALTASKVIGSFLFPLHFAIDGLRSLWDLYQDYRDKFLKQHPGIKQVRMGANLFNLVALGVAGIVLGVGVTNPWALPIIFAGIMGVGIYKAYTVSKHLSQLIAKEKAEISTLEQQIKKAKQGDIPNPQLDYLEAAKVRHQNQLEQLVEKHFQARRELVFGGISTVAVGMLMGGIFFPPLAFAGLILFGAGGLVNLIDAKTNCRFSRGIANFFSNLFSSKDKTLIESEGAALIQNSFVEEANDQEETNKIHAMNTALYTLLPTKPTKSSQNLDISAEFNSQNSNLPSPSASQLSKTHPEQDEDKDTFSSNP